MGTAERSHEGWVIVTSWLAQTDAVSASNPVMTKLRSLLSHSDPGVINKLHSHPRQQGVLQMGKSEREGSQVTECGRCVCSNRS